RDQALERRGIDGADDGRRRGIRRIDHGRWFSFRLWRIVLDPRCHPCVLGTAVGWVNRAAQRAMPAISLCGSFVRPPFGVPVSADVFALSFMPVRCSAYVFTRILASSVVRIAPGVGSMASYANYFCVYALRRCGCCR